jgi:hypothetical protein
MHLGVGVAQRLHRHGDLAQLLASGLELANHVFELLRRALDHLAGVLHVRIDYLVLAARVRHQAKHAVDVADDLLGGLVNPLGQLAHLVRDHGEAATGFTRPRSLDGGVERQQVGLVGDLSDQHRDLLDAFRARR